MRSCNGPSPKPTASAGRSIGRDWRNKGNPRRWNPAKSLISQKMMNAAGELRRDAPPGEWTVVRLGHATNLKMTRPVPAGELGLECDRLHPRGSDWSA